MIFRNIKDIAKLRGTEDLWEVAKLHNRESSFPEVLTNHYYNLSTDLSTIKIVKLSRFVTGSIQI